MSKLWDPRRSSPISWCKRGESEGARFPDHLLEVQNLGVSVPASNWEKLAVVARIRKKENRWQRIRLWAPSLSKDSSFQIECKNTAQYMKKVETQQSWVKYKRRPKTTWVSNQSHQTKEPSKRWKLHSQAREGRNKREHYQNHTSPRTSYILLFRILWCSRRKKKRRDPAKNWLSISSKSSQQPARHSRPYVIVICSRSSWETRRHQTYQMRN